MKKRIEGSLTRERILKDGAIFTNSGLILTMRGTIQIPLVNQTLNNKNFTMVPVIINDYGQEINKENMKYISYDPHQSRLTKNYTFKVLSCERETCGYFIKYEKPNNEIEEKFFNDFSVRKMYFLTEDEYNEFLELLPLSQFQRIDRFNTIRRITGRHTVQRKRALSSKISDRGLYITRNGSIQVPLTNYKKNYGNQISGHNYYGQRVNFDNMKYLAMSPHMSVISKKKVFKVESIKELENGNYLFNLKDFDDKIIERTFIIKSIEDDKVIISKELKDSYFLTEEEYEEIDDLFKLDKKSLYNKFRK